MASWAEPPAAVRRTRSSTCTPVTPSRCPAPRGTPGTTRRRPSTAWCSGCWRPRP